MKDWTTSIKPNKRLPLRIVESTTEPGQLSIRTEDGGMAGTLRRQLDQAGFEAGDDVILVSRAEFEELEPTGYSRWFPDSQG